MGRVGPLDRGARAAPASAFRVCGSESARDTLIHAAAKVKTGNMLLELGKFASLLLSILSLIALFYAAFLLPASGFEERILASLEMVSLAACVCWASGWIFYRWEQKAGVENTSVAASLPVKLFWWTSGAILVLFLISWYLEAYYLPLRSALGG